MSQKATTASDAALINAVREVLGLDPIPGTQSENGHRGRRATATVLKRATALLALLAYAHGIALDESARLRDAGEAMAR